MKKPSFWEVLIAVLALVAVVVAVCVYMKQLRQMWTNFWDRLQEKRANLQVYMD